MTGSFLWAQRLSTVALLAAGVCGASETCCERLAKGLSQKVIAPLNPEYVIENNKYWSSRSVLTPSCILVPESSSDVAKALKILVKNNCEFAVRGGGHTANPSWAGTSCGVLISLSKFTDIKVSKDEKSVIVGAGNRWGDVYTETEKYGVTVAGGRVSSVGVSGFLLGGGLSFLMHSEGFAANSVLSYEVVLANGTVSTVTAKSAGDLFKALKGGTGNFGIAASFTLQAYAIKDVYAGNLYYTPDKYDMLFPIMEQFARTGIESDPKTHMISTFISAPSQLLQLAAFYTFYSEPVTAPPPAIQPFFNVPTTVNTVGVKTVKQAVDELGTGDVNGLRQDMRAYSIRANADLYKQLVDHCHSITAELGSTPGWGSAIIFQPISNSMIRASDRKGGNVLGLEPADDPLILVSYQFTWELPQDDEKAYAAANRIIAESMDIAKSQNRLGRYVYLNYASTNQKPIESYGSDQVEFLQKVKAKYDPHRVFEKLCPGGFKVPSSS
ncbi:fad binding protein [Rhizoctonia solani]|uniref:Fad binding protein n=1 Tax=Rhizoctonia solani TaxID=456999 RepID=A0A8H7HGU0_9AGAM|nr:fad binding protein [Rhizoctonia solani]